MVSVRWTQWICLLAGSCCYVYFAIISLWGRLSSNDFKHIYLGMKALLDGSSPYPIQSLHHQAALQGFQQISLNPYVYLPFTGYSMAFLSPFDLPQAVNVWFVINHLFVFASAGLICQMFRTWRLGGYGLLLLALAFNVPLYRTLSAGQLNLEMLFLLSLGFNLIKRDRDNYAGVALAFATLFKLMPGIYGLYFLLRRKWIAVRWMVISGLLMLISSLFLAGLTITLQFIPVLKQMGYGKSTWPHVFSFWDDPSNQSLNSFFSHIMTESDHTRPWISLGQNWANAATWATTLFCLGIFMLTSINRKASSDKTFTKQDEASWCSTLIMGLLIPSLMWDHYLVLLILPVAWMIQWSLLKKYYKIAVLVSCCYIVTCVPWNFENTSWRSGAGILLMSLKLWPTLVLFGLSLCFIRWSVENVSAETHVLAEPIPAGDSRSQ